MYPKENILYFQFPLPSELSVNLHWQKRKKYVVFVPPHYFEKVSSKEKFTIYKCLVGCVNKTISVTRNNSDDRFDQHRLISFFKRSRSFDHQMVIERQLAGRLCCVPPIATQKIKKINFYCRAKMLRGLLTNPKYTGPGKQQRVSL